MRRKEKIFISYVREDKNYAKYIYQSLKRINVPVFIDTRDIQPGDEWGKRIIEELENCKYFILIHTDNLKNKEDSFVHKEINLALKIYNECKNQEDKLKIIAACFDESELYNENLAKIQYCSFVKAPKKGLKELFNVVKPLNRLKVFLIGLSAISVLIFLFYVYFFYSSRLSAWINYDIIEQVLPILLIFYCIVYDRINKKGFTIDTDVYNINNLSILLLLTGFGLVIYETFTTCQAFLILVLLIYLITYSLCLDFFQKAEREVYKFNQIMSYGACFILGGGLFSFTLLYFVSKKVLIKE